MITMLRILILLTCLLWATGRLHAQVVFPVRTAENGRYLVDQINKPFPILGRTAWFIISRSSSDYKTFIDNSIALGYNSIEMHVLNHDPRGNHPPFNGNGDSPFLKQLDGKDWNGSLVYDDINAQAPDLTTPNEKYWKYADDFLFYCETKGILVFFFPGYVGYVGSDQGWLEELIANGTSRSTAYGAWVANRYKNQKNLVWMLLGDMGSFTISQRNAEAALIKGLKSVSGQQSVHYSSEADAGQNSTDQKDFGSEVTLNGVYTWGSRATVSTLGRRAYSRNPVMAAFLLEEPYDEEGPDGNHVNPNAIQPVRRYQWWGCLTTIGGYIAGNGYVWPFIDPHWRNHLDTQGARDMGRLNTFIKSISWWDLKPSGLDGMKNLIAEGGGVETSDDYISAAATSDGTLCVAYVPPAHHGSFKVDMSSLSSPATAMWFDPTSGSYTSIEGSPFANAGLHEFTPPLRNSQGLQDWTLVLKTEHKR